tara:strand:- start:14745 stop:14945 length:201 start_codon:yes stop_codon:yes gene_type:complete
MGAGHSDKGLREQIKIQIEDYKENVSKFFDSGNNAAGTRARKALLDMTKTGKELRKMIQEIKNNQN